MKWIFKENIDPIALRTNLVNRGVFAPIFFLINSHSSLPTFPILSYVCVLSHLVMSVFFVSLWTVAHNSLLSMGILCARILEWVAIPSSRGSSQLRDRTQVSHIVGEFFII